MRCRSAAIEVGGNQILGAVLEHVICGGEDEAATAQIAFFGPRCVQAQELRLQLAGLCAGGGPNALHQSRFNQSAPIRSRVERRVPALSSLGGHRPA